MPKDKGNLVLRARKIVKVNSSFELQSKDESVYIFCKLCSSKFRIDEVHLNTQCNSHLKSGKHKKAVEKNSLQPSISSVIAATTAHNSRSNTYFV